jgi:hypothetical protein
MPPWWDWNAVGAIGQWAGAIATTAAVVVALSAERRTRRTHVTVGVVSGPLNGRKKGPAFVISAVNRSGRIVILDGAGILLPDGRELGPIVNDAFRGEIRDLEKKVVAFPQDDVARWLLDLKIVLATKLIFYVRDTTGKLHQCPFAFDPSPFRAP